jgi:hypothetical protein
MKKELFSILHEIWKEDLESHFFLKDGGIRNFCDHPYCIETKITLSLALRYFARVCPYNLILSHGFSYMSVFYSIWGVVDVINKNPI